MLQFIGMVFVIIIIEGVGVGVDDVGIEFFNNKLQLPFVLAYQDSDDKFWFLYYDFIFFFGIWLLP